LRELAVVRISEKSLTAILDGNNPAKGYGARVMGSARPAVE